MSDVAVAKSDRAALAGYPMLVVGFALIVALFARAVGLWAGAGFFLMWVGFALTMKGKSMVMSVGLGFIVACVLLLAAVGVADFFFGPVGALSRDR